MTVTDTNALLEHVARGIPKESLTLPGPGVIADVVRRAIINKRAGGVGVISGRKAFQRRREEGVALLHAIQDVYLDPAVNVA